MLDTAGWFCDNLTSHLYSQAECVEHDEHKHDVLKASGVHHIPELVLVGVFWDVPPQWTRFKSVLNALALQRNTVGCQCLL